METSEVYTVTDEQLQKVVRRILRAGSPQKVILFGSRAKGTEKTDSDVDLLIIDETASNHDDYDRAAEILEPPADVIVRTAAEMAAWRNVSNHFLTKVLREGRVLYERQTDLIRDSVPPKSQSDHAAFWIRIADRDLEDGTTLLATGGSYQSVCFFAQQAIEKYLKAVLAYDGADIPRTHNLRKLRRRLLRGPRLLQTDQRINRLSKYATNGRYGEDPRASHKLAVLALELARGIREIVVRELPAEALP
jgi:HEPN domain-containing protein/predicted nucleotidyltransferase